MKFAWIILGSLLCTIVLLGLELSHGDVRLEAVTVLLVIVLIREHLRAVWWYMPFFASWIGTTFLITNWLHLREEGQSIAAFATFGPGFLIMAAYQIIKHRFNGTRSTE